MNALNTFWSARPGAELARRRGGMAAARSGQQGNQNSGPLQNIKTKSSSQQIIQGILGIFVVVVWMCSVELG